MLVAAPVIDSRLRPGSLTMPKRKRRDSVASLPAAAAEPEPGQLCCWVCLEPHVRATRSGATALAKCGCACRGSGAGYAHIPCLIRLAQHNRGTWGQCPTCKEPYSGSTMLSLARARVRLAEEAKASSAGRMRVGIGQDGILSILSGEAEEEEISDAMNMLASVLISCARYTEARQLLEQLVARDVEQYGHNNALTACSKTGLAQALLDMGDFAAARTMAEALVAQLESQFLAAMVSRGPGGSVADGVLDAMAGKKTSLSCLAPFDGSTINRTYAETGSEAKIGKLREKVRFLIVLAQALAYGGEDSASREMWQEIITRRAELSDGQMTKEVRQDKTRQLQYV